MLRMPSRSVTRFFIPLIDVLTLLFAVFLIMPVTYTSGDQPSELANKTPEEQVDYLRQENKRLREESSRIRQEIGQELKVPPKPRILEIDPKSGGLFDSDADRTEIRTKEQARQLIERDRRRFGRPGWKLYYTILYPRDRTSDKPLVRQREMYEDWFRAPDVAVDFDVPGEPGK